MGSDLTVKNSHNKTVSHPVKQKSAKVAYDFTKPIYKLGRNDEGGHWEYVFRPDEGTLSVCSDTGTYCAVAKDTDKNGKFDTATITKFDEYSKSEEKLDENNPKYDVQTFARNSLMALLQQDKEYHPPKVDIKGKIGKFRQSYTMGDCGLLGSTLALSFPKEGAKIIKNSVSRDGDDFRVRLQGIGEDFIISPEEIHYSRFRLSRGSDDMRLIELTLEKDTIDSAQYRLRQSKMYPGMFDENSIKQELKETIDGYSPRSVFLRLTKSRVDEADGHNWELKADVEDPFQPPVWEHVDFSNQEEVKQERQKTQKFLDEKMKHPDKIALYASIIVDKKIPFAHGVGVKKVDKKNVVYVNPWDSSKKIKVTREEFMNQHFDTVFCDLRTRRSKEEDNFAR